MNISKRELKRRAAKLRREIAGDDGEDEPQTFTTLLNITWELKDFFSRFQKKFELQKIAIGTLSGRECIYLMLKDGRRVRVRLEEVKQQPTQE